MTKLKFRQVLNSGETIEAENHQGDQIMAFKSTIGDRRFCLMLNAKCILSTVNLGPVFRKFGDLQCL
jgi:hypothetical protein